MNKFIIEITSEDDTFLQSNDIECVILGDSFSPAFYNKAKSFDKIILISGDNAVSICMKYGFDGITADLSKSEQIKEDMASLRQDLKDKFVGIISRSRRHEAMLISEEEPEFIIFKVWKDGLDNTRELLDWYNEFFLIQSAAVIEDDDVDINSLNVDIVILKDVQYKKFVAKS